MRHLSAWSLAGLLVLLGCGGMDSFDTWAPDDEAESRGIEGPITDGSEELEEPCFAGDDGLEAIGEAARADSAPGVFIVERVDGDDGDPLVSDEFLEEEE